MRQMIDIALYIHSFAGGGAERVMIQLANHWAGQGKSVVFIVNQDSGALRDLLDPAVQKTVLGARGALFGVIPLARTLKTLRPGALLSAIPEINVAAVTAGRLSGLDLRIVVVEHISISNRVASGNAVRRSLLPFLIKTAYPHADYIAAVSNAARDELRRLLKSVQPERISTLYNPVWPMAPVAGEAAADVHPWFGQEVPALLAVGRLSEQKNHANLLKAFAIARADRPLKLIVIGEGPLEHELKHLALELGVADDVDFLGYQSAPGRFYHAADLFVLSSDFEGLPLSIMEALSCGLQVVSTNCPSGPDELLEGGSHGVLVPVANPQGLADGILHALDHPIPPEQLRRRATAFEIEAVARAYESLLFGAASRPGSSVEYASAPQS